MESFEENERGKAQELCIKNSQEKGIEQLQGKLKGGEEVDHVLGAVPPSSLVWEMVLDRVEDSKDVFNVLKVIPELDISYQIKKRLWLFGLVIRILINRLALKENDLLNCRLVCKQWKMRVDWALETQSVFRVYDLVRDKEEKDYWKGFDNSIVLANSWMHYRHWQKFFGGTFFNCDFTNAGKFLEDMKCCPRTKNPFVGRALTILVTHNEPRRPKWRVQNHEEVFWRDLFRVLERYGRHVWHLRLLIFQLRDHDQGYEANSPQAAWSTFMQILALLPNLKSFKLEPWGRMHLDELLYPSLNLRPQPPSLAYLECFSIPFFTLPLELIHPVLALYGNQLRKLEIAVGYWREGMGSLFKNLTELELISRDLGKTIPHWQTTCELIPSIVAPNLVTLRVNDCRGKEIVIESDVFSWLRGFPALKCLDIVKYFELREENLIREGPIEKFPSLERLSIEDSGKLSFNFLRSFPSLRELKIFRFVPPLVTDLSIPESQIKLREQLQSLKIYYSNIWEHLPKLYSVIVYVGDNWAWGPQEMYEFSREQYERIKQGRKDKMERL